MRAAPLADESNDQSLITSRTPDSARAAFEKNALTRTSPVHRLMIKERCGIMGAKEKKGLRVQSMNAQAPYCKRQTDRDRRFDRIAPNATAIRPSIDHPRVPGNERIGVSEQRLDLYRIDRTIGDTVIR